MVISVSDGRTAKLRRYKRSYLKMFSPLIRLLGVGGQARAQFAPAYHPSN